MAIFPTSTPTPQENPQWQNLRREVLSGILGSKKEDSFSPKEATQNVMFQKEFGSGLAAQKAMQSPDYALGSGSALRQPARRIGTLSGDLNRASRRLRRQGYTAQAAQMAGQAEMQRMTEPSITTQADRELGMAMNIQQGKMAMEDEAYKRRMMGLTEQLLRKRLEEPA